MKNRENIIENCRMFVCDEKINIFRGIPPINTLVTWEGKITFSSLVSGEFI